MIVLPAGPTALLVELDGLEDVFALVDEVARRQRTGWEPGLTEVVPGARTVLLDGISDPRRVEIEIRSWHLPQPRPVDHPDIELTCRYDGPDLEVVARHWSVTVDEVSAIHSSLSHRVSFCGFAPGFAYLDGLGERWWVPRRSTPRQSVNAGSVGIAASFTGVYPRRSPGGWQLIGHTDAQLWDLERVPAALLTPGARVRFVPV